MNFDWDFSLLDEFIDVRGEQVVHLIAIRCPCGGSDPIASNVYVDGRLISRDMNCSQCKGDGFIYRDPQCITGLLTQVRPNDRLLLEVGYAMPGDSVFSPKIIERQINHFDKIVFMKPEAVNEGQVIVRNARNLSYNKDLPKVLEDDEDLLAYKADCAIWCEDANRNIYYQNADFVFEGRTIKWIGKRPLDGTKYVIKYTGLLEWIVYAQPMSRQDRGRDLGQKVMLRKKHIYFLDQAENAKENNPEVAFKTSTVV